MLKKQTKRVVFLQEQTHLPLAMFLSSSSHHCTLPLLFRKASSFVHFNLRSKNRSKPQVTSLRYQFEICFSYSKVILFLFSFRGCVVFGGECDQPMDHGDIEPGLVLSYAFCLRWELDGTPNHFGDSTIIIHGGHAILRTPFQTNVRPNFQFFFTWQESK